MSQHVQLDVDWDQNGKMMDQVRQLYEEFMKIYLPEYKRKKMFGRLQELCSIKKSKNVTAIQ